MQILDFEPAISLITCLLSHLVIDETGYAVGIQSNGNYAQLDQAVQLVVFEPFCGDKLLIICSKTAELNSILHHS